MQTAIQALTSASLTKRQINSMRSLQNKVESPDAMSSTTRVSAAQFKAMQAAYDAVVKAGLPIDPVMSAAAKRIGLV
jgi:hypothetical protein